MDRLHPHDLRAIMAAIIHGPIKEGTSLVVEATDHLLGHLDATARRLTSPGLEPPRPTGCPSCAQAEAQVDRLKAALDLEAKARVAMAEGLAEAKEERDKLVADARTMAEALATCERWLQCRCSRPEGMDYRDECPRCSKESPRVDLLRGMSAADPYLPDDSPAIRADDLVEALDGDPSTTLERVQ